MSTDAFVTQQAATGILWATAGQVVRRVLAFLSTLAVAHLLPIADIGLVGMALLTVNIIQTFSEAGIRTAVIQKREGYQTEVLNAAWTADLCRNIILGLFLFAAAPLAADFFVYPSLSPILKAFSAIFLFIGLDNIGTSIFVKRMAFKQVFALTTAGAAGGCIATIVLAYSVRNAWAVVLGAIVGQAVACTASYLGNPFRPKILFSWGTIKQLLHYGKWVFGSTALIFLSTHGDDILVGKLLGTTMLAFYQMAYLISNIPATDITHVVAQVAFSAYSHLQDDLASLRKRYAETVRLTVMISFPLAGLIFVLSPLLVQIFLGDRWMPIIPALRILCIFGMTRSFGATTGPFFQGVGKPELLTKLTLAYLLLMALIIYPLTMRLGIIGTAIAVTAPSILTQTVSVVIATSLVQGDRRYLAKSIVLPLIAAAVMAGSIFFIMSILPLSFALIKVTLLALLGAIIYVLVLCAIGKPFGYDPWKMIGRLWSIWMKNRVNA